MKINITARHFKIHPTIHDAIVDAVNNLNHFYDGIVSVEVILSFERVRNSLKCVELVLHLHDHFLTITEKSEDYLKSLDFAIKRMVRLLVKFKEKQNNHHRSEPNVIEIEE